MLGLLTKYYSVTQFSHLEVTPYPVKNVTKFTVPSEGNTIECLNTGDGGKGTDKHLGTITQKNEECSATIFGIKGLCNSVGAGSGRIEFTGSYHLGLGTDGNPKKPAILLLAIETEIKCTILGISKGFKVRGNVVGLLRETAPGKPPLKVLPTEYDEFELVFASVGMGVNLKQEDTTFELSLGGGVADTAKLESDSGNGFTDDLGKGSSLH